MKNQITAAQMGTGNRLIKQLGRCMLFLYTVASYVSYSDRVPTSLNSLTLFVLLGFGIINFAINNRFRTNNLHFIWYSVFTAFSFVWIVVLELYWPGAEWASSLYQVAVVLGLSLSFSQFLESKKDIRMVCYAYMLGAVLLMGLLAMDNRLTEDTRLGATITGNSNIFAGLYMMAAIMSIWMAINGKNIWEKLLFWAGIIVIFYGLLLSGGRKYVLIPILVLYIMLLLRKDKRGRNHILLYTALIAALFGSLIWLMMSNKTLYQSVGYRMQNLFNMIEGEGEIGSSNEIRMNLINLAFTAGFESPIWGHGFDAFKNLGQRELQFYAYSHNNWTEMWYNYGIIGVVVYYWLYVKLVTGFWKYRNTAQDLASFGIAAIVSTFVFEYGAVTYHGQPNQMLICICAAVLVICRQEREPSDGKD